MHSSGKFAAQGHISKIDRFHLGGVSKVFQALATVIQQELNEVGRRRYPKLRGLRSALLVGSHKKSLQFTGR